MKKMQKILCMLLALAMLLSFAACAAKEAAPSTTDTPRCGCGRCKDGNQSRGHPGRAAGSGAA